MVPYRFGMTGVATLTIHCGVRRMTVVYWDRVVVLNGIVDYLLLLSAAWLSGLPLRRGRLALWAALGGLYAGAVFLPGLEVLGVPVIRAAAGIVMALGAMKWRCRWF